MILIYDSEFNINSPFFTVCIETDNRGKTIYRALESLLHQQTSNFECVLVDDISNDDTISEIKRFTSSETFLNKPFSLRIFQNEQHLGGVLNWNSPLEYANGTYISVLEGDDYFQQGHLKKAEDFLSVTPNIGIYATGSQRALRPLKGIIPSKEYFSYLYQIINVAPPSEAIFIKFDKQGRPFRYDTVNNVYAPELQLWLMISNDGWDAFHTSTADVYREKSTSVTHLTWNFFADKFNIIKKYHKHPLISEKQFVTAFGRQFKLAIRKYLIADFMEKGNAESIKDGLENVLRSNNHSHISKYKRLMKTVLLMKKIGVFQLYFSVKK